MRIARLLILTSLLCCALQNAAAQAVVGEMFASDASVHGSVLFAGGGTQIQSGSSVTAGEAAALLRLKRGGEVRICPKTTLSVTSASNGNNLLLGMDTGSIEAHYMLQANADAIVTPDFRILLAGPGTFHFAISANAHGDACVQALPSNTASLIVSELNGEGMYQVKPNEQVLFRAGKVADPLGLVPAACGCPPEAPKALAEIPPRQLQTEPAPNEKYGEGLGASVAKVFEPAVNESPRNSILIPQVKAPAEDLHLEAEKAFVYHPADPEQELAQAVMRLRLISGSNFAQASVLPPETAAAASGKPKAKEKKGFLGKIGSFFSSIFK